MIRTLPAAALVASAALAAVAGAAPPPGRPALTLREPGWKGGAPSLVTPAYTAALARLQELAASHPEGVPLRVTSPAPCVLRLARGNDLAAYADATRGFLHQVTWIDLSKGTALDAQAFGRKQGTGPAMVATCAWLAGAPGFAVSTQVVALAGKPAALRQEELAPEEQPRLCLGNELEPVQLSAPLRELISICGGRAGPAAQGR